MKSKLSLSHTVDYEIEMVSIIYIGQATLTNKVNGVRDMGNLDFSKLDYLNKYTHFTQ